MIKKALPNPSCISFDSQFSEKINYHYLTTLSATLCKQDAIYFLLRKKCKNEKKKFKTC